MYLFTEAATAGLTQCHLPFYLAIHFAGVLRDLCVSNAQVKFRSCMGMGFSFPASDVERWLQELPKGGRLFGHGTSDRRVHSTRRFS